MQTYVSEEMHAAVGRELDRRVSFPVSESDIRRWAIAVYYPEVPPRLFWDAEYAAGTPFGGIVAPEEFNPFAWPIPEPRAERPSEAPDPPDPPAGSRFHGIERTLGIEPPATRHGLNGGMAAEYGERMRPGDVITAVGTLVGYRERGGRLGVMLFTTRADTWTNQRGELVKRTELTLIRY